MKKRTNMYLDEQDKVYISIRRERYNLSTDAAVRLAVKRIASEKQGKESK